MLYGHPCIFWRPDKNAYIHVRTSKRYPEVYPNFRGTSIHFPNPQGTIKIENNIKYGSVVAILIFSVLVNVSLQSISSIFLQTLSVCKSAIYLTKQHFQRCIIVIENVSSDLDSSFMFDLLVHDPEFVILALTQLMFF